MARFFLDPGAWGEDASLSGDEAKHCARVMRARVGDRIEVFDGRGKGAEAWIESIGSREVGLRVGEVSKTPLPKTEIVLVPAVLKGKAMEWLIQKAVEIGVSAIETVTTCHAVVRPGEGKEEKWRRIALEACKQCGQNRLPEIPPPRPLGEWLGGAGDELKIIASLAHGSRSIREVLKGGKRASKVAYLVGPEGDFTEAETDACLKGGFLPVSLGPRVLRAETAGIFGVSALNYEYLLTA